jgi:hypothetical protein
MHTPGLFESVRLIGFDETYLVTHVDHEAQRADLLPIVFSLQQLQAVTFLALESNPASLPELERRPGYGRYPAAPL